MGTNTDGVSSPGSPARRQRSEAPLAHSCAGGCGRQVLGTYCRLCYGAKEQRRAAMEQYTGDQWLLSQRAAGVPVSEIARQLKVVRQRAYQKLQAAERREGVRSRDRLPSARP